MKVVLLWTLNQAGADARQHGALGGHVEISGKDTEADPLLSVKACRTAWETATQVQLLTAYNKPEAAVSPFGLRLA